MTITSTPSFEGWSNVQIQGWIDANPTNLEGIKQARAALAVSTPGDVNGAATGRGGSSSGITLPAPSANIDAKSAAAIMANFEELLVLFQLMAGENKKFSRQDANALLEKATNALLQAADKKDAGAEKMMTMAIVCLVITVVGAALSIILAPLSAVTGGATQGAQKAAEAATKGMIQAVKEAVKNTIQQGVRHTIKVILQALMKGAIMTLSNPQVAMGFFQGISGSLNAMGQSKSLQDQSAADRLSAEATKSQAEQKKAEEIVGDFREVMKKMNDLLRTLYDAKVKSEEAAAKA